MTILIVDDELAVRTYLTTAMDWKGSGYELLEAENGKIAIDIMKNHSINLLILDITMPLMNGLEVLDWMHSNDYSCVVSLLTCHDDFEFARTALKSGCFDYLLKNSITDETFKDLIKRMSQVASDDAKKKQQHFMLETVALRNEQQEIRSRIYYWLSHPPEPTQNIESYFETKLGFRKTKHNFVLLMVHFDNYKQAVQRYTDNDNVHFLSILDNILGELAGNNQLFALPQEGILTVFLGFDKHLLLHDIIKEICNIAETLNGSSLQMKCWLRYSLPFSTIDDSHRIYNEMKNLEVLNFYPDTKQTLCISDYVTDAALCNTFLNEFKHRFMQELQQRNMAQIEIFYDETVSLIALHMYNISSATFIQTCQQCIHEFLVRYNSESAFPRMEHPAFKSSKEYKLYILELLHAYCVPDDTSDKKNLIKKAVLLVQQNYSEDIGLEWLAEKLWVNASYLSRQFSHEVGQPLSNYISTYRIAQAKKLIRESNLKLYQIASKTGFSSSIVFSSVFKKITGETPTDYKNRIL